MVASSRRRELKRAAREAGLKREAVASSRRRELKLGQHTDAAALRPVASSRRRELKPPSVPPLPPNQRRLLTEA